MRGHLKMGKISGGFWPFLAGKRAVSDSELLVTLNHYQIQNADRSNIKTCSKNWKKWRHEQAKDGR